MTPQPLHHLYQDIKNLQSDTGSFESVSYTELAQKHVVRSTTFYTSLILSILAPLPDTETITTSATRWLLTNRSNQWTWNYWERGSADAAAHPYPDDMDDTCMALAGISTSDPSVITGEAFAQIIATLIAQETTEGGPYQTWIMHPLNRWDDVDVAVNANIMHALSLYDIRLSNLDSYIEKMIISDRLCSKYYHSPLAIIYFIARSYTGTSTTLLLHKIESLKQGTSWGNPLLDALVVTAWIRLGGNPDTIRDTLESLRTVSTYEPYPFFIEHIQGGTIHYSGSSAFTMTAIYEAISVATHLPKQAVADPYLAQTTQTVRAAHLRIRDIDEALYSDIEHAITKLMTHDTRHEIALTPYFFAQGRCHTTEDMLTALGTANILGWIGYGIYDDILDTHGTISLLPAANKCVREATLIFKELLPDPVTFARINTILDGIEAANLWEHVNCNMPMHGNIITLPDRLPTYDDHRVLAQKSFGHAIGPIIVSMHASTATSALVTSTTDFFTHYLIARQLNDDAHDWHHDLEKGFINSASVRIIETLRANGKPLPFIDLDSGLYELQETFWQTTIDDISSLIIGHCDKALNALAACTTGIHDGYFIARIDALRQSAYDAQNTRDATRSFITAYKSTLAD